MKVTKMWWIKSSTENSYLRDGINPGPYEVLSKEVAREGQRQINQRRLVEQQVRERSLNTKS
jgi:hypothetical protein